jgi:hypothetical protein
MQGTPLSPFAALDPGAFIVKRVMIMTRPTRFRLFYVLLDAATLVTLISLGRMVADPSSMFEDRPNALIFQVAGVLAVLLPAILIFVRAIRDEFAEQLWQAAAGATLRGLIWIPFALLFLWGIVEGLSGAPDSDLDMVISGTQMLALMLMLQLTLFVLSLQWHRWRTLRE